MSCRTPGKVVALDNALMSLALGISGHIDQFTAREVADANFFKDAKLHLLEWDQSFTEPKTKAVARFLEMAYQRLSHIAHFWSRNLDSG